MANALAVHLLQHYSTRKPKEQNYQDGLPRHKLQLIIDSVKAQWEGLISFSSHSKSEELLSQIASIPLAEAKAEFEAKLEALQTEQGIWDDLTTLFILGRK